MPKDQCGTSLETSPNGTLWLYGFYRKLNNGQYEFFPFCKEGSRDFFGIYKTDLERILDATIPQKDKKKIMDALESSRIE